MINQLRENRDLSDRQFIMLLEQECDDEKLFDAANQVRKQIYGNDVYIRGLIEFTNYCKNDCYYCGIRAGNATVSRYRLSEEAILSCCQEAYHLGFRTFVLQGGEDGQYSDDDVCRIVGRIKEQYSDCAVTLSIGERSYQGYQRFFEAGATRYLLRHETADEMHYAKLHPNSMSLANRKRCLFDLKEIGYQVGSGFMVGSPYQTTAQLIQDLRFLQELQPDMIGIGPYIMHSQTPFAGKPDGSLSLTLRLISILRLMFPYALIPATTALGTIAHNGRELGLKAGANVVMPNLSPIQVRKQYALYDNKICTGKESAQCVEELKESVRAAGYCVVTDVGDVKKRKLL